MMTYRIPQPITRPRLLCLLALGLWSFPAFGAPPPWQHVATTHFGLSYTPATAHLVEEAAQIAEETRSTLTEYFGDLADFRFLSIVLSDDSDLPNGGASTLDPVVWIDCRKTQSLFRGETDWLRTVLTHELSHQYSLRLQKKLDLIKPADSFTVSGEAFRLTLDSRRGPVELPLWFVEGLAQMGSRKVGADGHDAIRRMVLREAVARGRLLTLEEMGRFEGTQRDQELVYNQGFSFLIYLEEAFPQVPLARLCAAVAQKDFLLAFPDVYHQTLAELYQQWVATWGKEPSPPPTPTGTPLFDRQGAMVVETSTAGAYVVANWDNDYHRFGLFQHDGAGYRPVARDTGPTVKAESTANGAWYTQQTFDITTGAVGYEVFRLDAKGNSRQVTQGSRVLAFDVLDGHLAYARYRYGQTELLVRRPDGTENSLGQVPQGSAVYSLSLVNQGTALVSLGTGPKVHAAVVSRGTWSLLWPEAEVMDLVAAGEDRVLFSSTLEGSPQLYWTDLVRDPGTWYPITKAAFGARFPSWDPQTSRLTYSEYSEGGWRRMAWPEELSASGGVRPPGPSVSPWNPLPAPVPDQGLKTSAANPILHVEPVTVGLFFQKGSRDLPATLATIGWMATVFDAPKDWSASAAYAFESVYDPAVPSQPTHNVELGATFDAGPLKNAVTFRYQAESQYYNQYGYQFLTYNHRSLLAQSTLPTAADQSLTLAYRGNWSDHTTLTPVVNFLGLHEAQLRWDWFRSPVSVFDPAQLGQTGVAGYAAGQLFVPQVLNPLYWDGSVILLNSGPVPRLETGWGFRLLTAGSRLSAGVSLQAASSPGAISQSLVFPWALTELRSLGFSGYPTGYGSMVHVGAGRLSVRTNPLVETKDTTQWFERLGIGAAVLAGAGQYVDAGAAGGLRIGFPVSAEVSFTASFYTAPDHPSEVEVGFAMALNDFAFGSGAPALLPYQVTAKYVY